MSVNIKCLYLFRQLIWSGRLPVAEELERIEKEHTCWEASPVVRGNNVLYREETEETLVFLAASDLLKNKIEL